MAEKINIRIASLQFALFFKDIVDRPDIEFSSLNETMLNIFDAIPAITPIPTGLPSDIPIVNLRSTSGNYLCDIARSRIDLHFVRNDLDKSNPELLNDFNSKIVSFVNYVLTRRNIIRFGMICRYFSETPQAVEIIKNKYLTSNMQDVQELGIRYNKQTTFLKWKINDIVEINSSDADQNSNTKSRIFIQRDINNSLEIEKNLTQNDLRDISEKYSGELTEKSIGDLLI